MGAPKHAQKLYQVKHRSGRLLGPLDLERIEKLIKKKELTGDESAREHPSGVWAPLITHAGMAELVLRVFSDEEIKKSSEKVVPEEIVPPTVVYEDGLSPEEIGRSTQIVSDVNRESAASGNPAPPPPPDQNVPSPAPIEFKEPEQKPKPEPEARVAFESLPEKSLDLDIEQAPQSQEAATVAVEAIPNTLEEKTVISATEFTKTFQTEFIPPVVSSGLEPTEGQIPKVALLQKLQKIEEPKPAFASEKTVRLERPKTAKKSKRIQFSLLVLFALVGAYFGLDLEDAEKAGKKVVSTAERLKGLRPRLPPMAQPQRDPIQSQKAYLLGLREYVKDNVKGYLNAEAYFYKAATLDRENMKAVALLASTYLNLVDTTLKDENYFTVILKLIEMAKAKAPELAEVAIAETEFFLVSNQPEAALNILEAYTKKSPQFDQILFYYGALCAYQKKDYPLSLKLINKVTDAGVSTARVYSLRGDIAKALGDLQNAKSEYERALRYDPKHNTSRLKLVSMFFQQGQLKENKEVLFQLSAQLDILKPLERAEGYYYLGQFFFLHEKWRNALQAFENAVKYDSQNLTYVLDLYTLKSRAGDASSEERAQVKMYLYLSEGARAQKEGNTQGAILNFLKAKDASPGSVLPPLRLGDLFLKEENWVEARQNFKQAFQRAPTNPDILSKYVYSLLKNYEWAEAQMVMSKVKGQSWSNSALDKLAGDLYMAQGRLREAEAFYKKAMLRETIDPEVYLSYAKLLNQQQNFKLAPLYFALAYRLDPLNIETLFGTARSIAGEESIQAAINYLKKAIERGSFPKAPILVTLAEYEVDRGELKEAKRLLEEARTLDPNYAKSFLVLAKIHLFDESTDKNALKKALDAYQAYSTRNRADPAGYMERFKIFLKMSRFDEAKDELDLIYMIYPKYPNLHYFKGVLYDQMGNSRVAVEEFVSELKNNPASIPALIGAGKSYNLLKDPKTALSYLNRAMALAPQAPEPKFQAALSNRYLKNYVGALALFKAAIALDPGNPRFYKELGICFKMSGDPGRAREAFRKYLQMEPDAVDKNEVQSMM